MPEMATPTVTKWEEFMAVSQQLVAWSDEFSLNTPEIDQQHQQLIELINQIWIATIDQQHNKLETLRIVYALERYTVTHFTAEEIFMREIGYPKFAAHKQAHDHFVARIRLEKARVAAGERLNLDIVHYLKDWLINHILVADKEYTTEYAKRAAPATLLGKFFRKILG
jgi:hemerythrin-like metal-binding protein